MRRPDPQTTKGTGMDKFLRANTSEYTRRRFTQNIFFKLGMGCLGLLFLLACLGTLVFIYLMPTQ
jgi:hypothetical protein